MRCFAVPIVVNRVAQKQKELREIEKEIVSCEEKPGPENRIGEINRFGKMKIYSLNSKLSETRKAPPVVINALPKCDADARSIVFLSFMPKIFDVLFCVTFIARSVFNFESWLNQPKVVVQKENSWGTFFFFLLVGLYSCSGGTGNYFGFKGFNKQEYLPYGPVDIFDTANAIFYPPLAQPCFTWSRGTNPFQDMDIFSPSLLTESLKHKCLSGYMNLCDAKGEGTSKRGNTVLATQRQHSNIPLSLPELLAFGSLRSYPYIQTRKLLSLLRRKELPLGEPDVCVLIRQALYHVGPISSSKDEPYLLSWKHEIFHHHSLMELQSVLRQEIEVLRHTLKNKKSMLMVSELLCFVCEMKPKNEDGLGLLRDCVTITREWGKKLTKQIENAASNRKEKARLIVAQMIFWLYGLCCYQVDPIHLNSKDIQLILGLRLQIAPS